MATGIGDRPYETTDGTWAYQFSVEDGQLPWSGGASGFATREDAGRHRAALLVLLPVAGMAARRIVERGDPTPEADRAILADPLLRTVRLNIPGALVEGLIAAGLARLVRERGSVVLA